MGDCFGKTAILNVAVEPAVDCLQVEGDNCNGGLPDIRNHCSEDLVLANVTAPAGEYSSLDVVREADGSFSLKAVDYNFSEFKPEEEPALSFTGLISSQEITFSFTKTAPLCD